jgi:hypothetical protein
MTMPKRMRRVYDASPGRLGVGPAPSDQVDVERDGGRLGRSALESHEHDPAQDEDAADELHRPDRLAEERPRDDRGEHDLREPKERREASAEQPDGLDAGDVGEGRRDRAHHEHRHPPRGSAAEEVDVGELGFEGHESRERRDPEHEASDEASGCGECDRRNPEIRSLSEHVVDRHAEHRDARDHDADGVERTACGADHEHEACDGDHRSGEHDVLGSAPSAQPREGDERNGREVLDEQRRAHGDTRDRGVERELDARDGDDGVDEHGPLRAPERAQVESEGEESGHGEQDRRHGDAEEHRGTRRPSGLEERFHDRATSAEGQACCEAEDDPEDAA